MKRHSCAGRLRVLGAIAALIASLFVASQAARACDYIYLYCLECDSYMTWTVDCCGAGNCYITQATDGDCSEPAICSRMCDGHIYTQWSYCS
jgi:hypothetical protein